MKNRWFSMTGILLSVVLVSVMGLIAFPYFWDLNYSPEKELSRKAYSPNLYSHINCYYQESNNRLGILIFSTYGILAEDKQKIIRLSHGQVVTLRIPSNWTCASISMPSK